MNTSPPKRKIRVLVVDDSATIRQVFSRELGRDPAIEVVGTAPDPFVARDMILKLKPDVLTLDLEMPRMDGLTFLSKLMQFHPLPVVVVSSLTEAKSPIALQALSTGAVDVLFKHGAAYSSGNITETLIEKVKEASTATVRKILPSPSGPLAGGQQLSKTTNQIVAIGCSTGGTQALEYVLPSLPASMPGILIVQHMPENFTRSFAERLNASCSIEVKEAEDGDSVAPGRALIAPGNRHMVLSRSGARYVARIQDGERVGRHRPSVNVLFDSVAVHAGENAVGLIMTGMGDDGATGMLAMHDAGANTIAQDEASSVVFGMPQRAFALGGVDKVVGLDGIPQAILAALNTPRGKGKRVA